MASSWCKHTIAHVRTHTHTHTHMHTHTHTHMHTHTHTHTHSSGELAHDHGGSDFICEKDHEARSRLWKARHESYYAELALEPGKKVTNKSFQACTIWLVYSSPFQPLSLRTIFYMCQVFVTSYPPSLLSQ